MRVHRMFSHRNVLNERMIDPRLQTLRMLRETGTVTAAAAALHLTPSTVSQQLRLLGRDLGVRLLEAHGRRVRLTPAAQTVLDHADVLYAQWERARADLAAYQDGRAGVIRVCGVSSALAALAAPAADRLRQERPGRTVRLSEKESGDCFRLLLTGDADVAVLLPAPDDPPPGDPRFDRHPLLDEPQDLLLPRDHRLAVQATVSLDAAADEPWIGGPDRADQHHLMLAACAAAGFTPDIAHEAYEWFAVSALVANGFGVSLVPRLVPLPPHDAVVRVPLHGTPRPSRRIIACVRHGAGRQPDIADALAALADIAAQRT